MYLCPKGFSGTYKVLIRRVFGQVATGKVLVEGIVHYNTPQARTVCSSIALIKGEAMVMFDLSNGRRNNQLNEQQVAVANAAVGQIAQSRQVLAQQMAALADPNAVGAGYGPGRHGGNHQHG